MELRTGAPPAAEPRWPALVGLLAVGGVYLAIPEPLSFGPNWLVLLISIMVVVPAMVAHRTGRARLNRTLGYVESGVITLALVWSLGELIDGLLSHRDPAPVLLRGAGALWFANILVFASWYWRLDAGGPHVREQKGRHVEGAFLFPQMTMERAWRPGFVDYLFLAFNTSTAFSPTDVSPLSRWAKFLMMIQSIISLGTLALVAARAVNIL